jgi:hypothetical protein
MLLTSLKTDIELKVVNVTVKLFGDGPNLRVRVPFLEACIR